MKFRKNQADGTMGILSVTVIRTYERGTNPLFREALVLFRVAIGIAVNFRIPVFIRCNMQSKRHLLSQVARRRSAAFECHSGRAD